MELTEIGQLLMTITRGIGDEEEAINLLRAAQALELGSLKIGAIRPGNCCRAAHPDLRLTQSLFGSARKLEGFLLSFDFDVGGYHASAGCTTSTAS